MHCPCAGRLRPSTASLSDLLQALERPPPWLFAYLPLVGLLCSNNVAKPQLMILVHHTLRPAKL